MPSWKLTKKKNNDDSTLQIFTLALKYKFVTVNGGLTELGYKVYLSLLGVIGKHSINKAPPRKSYIWFESIEKLKELDFVIYDSVKYEYLLSNTGKNMIKILALCLTNNGVPKI